MRGLRLEHGTEPETTKIEGRGQQIKGNSRLNKNAPSRAQNQRIEVIGETGSAREVVSHPTPHVPEAEPCTRVDFPRHSKANPEAQGIKRSVQRKKFRHQRGSPQREKKNRI